VYPFDRTTGTFGTQQVLTSFAPAGQLYTLQFSKCGNFLIGGGPVTPFLFIWNFSAASGVTSGPVAGISTTLLSQVNDITVHPNNEYFTASLNLTPFMITFPMPRSAKNYIRLAD
jgi:hypothetical protein